jgi:HemY protein
MRRVLAFVIAAVLIVAVAWWVAGLQGHVAIEVGSWGFAARTPAAVLAAVVVFLVLYVVLRLIGSLFRAPGKIARRRLEGRRARGDVAITRTLLALAAGENGSARREARNARRFLGDTPQTLLLTAEAARLSGDDAEAEAAFQALTQRPDAAFLGYRGLLRIAVEREDWETAAALGRAAETAHPGAGWVRAERGQIAVRTGNWNEALALADDSLPKSVLATAAAEAESDPVRARRLARQAWNETPNDPAAALAYARRLRETGRESRAQAVLRQTWAANPVPELAEFALAGERSVTGRLPAARRLVGGNADHAESRLLLARELLAIGQPAEAQKQAEAAHAAGCNQRRMWLLMADASEALDDTAGTREALRGAAGASPDPAWRCDACGTETGAWVPVCPACGKVGTIGWSTLTSGPVVTAGPTTLSPGRSVVPV